jgi:hypothetical protein
MTRSNIPSPNRGRQGSGTEGGDGRPESLMALLYHFDVLDDVGLR